MKELTTLNSKFTESEVNKSEVSKREQFSRSHNFDFTCIHFNIYECLKWLEKPAWLTSSFMIVQICSINTEAGVPRWSFKTVFLTVLQNSQ